MAVVRWLRPPPYKRLSLANKRAFSIIAEIPIAELEMKRRIRVCEREDCTLVAWYSSFYAPRTGGAYAPSDGGNCWSRSAARRLRGRWRRARSRRGRCPLSATIAPQSRTDSAIDERSTEIRLRLILE